LGQLEFLIPELNGKRFEGHALPFSYFKDLVALEKLVIEVARWQYFQNEGERKRLPNGFYDGVELGLVRIDSCCIRPVIALFFASSVGFLGGDNTRYFTSARDSIVNTITASHSSELFEPTIPTHSLRYFRSIGGTLQDGESITFRIPNKPEIFGSLTPKSRERLVSAATDENRILRQVDIRGGIPEYDQEHNTCIIRNAWGKRIEVKVTPEHGDTILNAFNGFQQDAKVLYSGIGLCRPDGRLKQMEEVNSITILDPLDVLARIDDLCVKCSKPGWLNGVGKPITEAAVSRYSRMYESYYPVNMPLPYTYPTEEGNLLHEWTFGKYEVSLEVNLCRLNSYWHVLDMLSSEVQEESLDLSSASGWQKLAHNLEALKYE
jgi:hypothetical protein